MLWLALLYLVALELLVWLIETAPLGFETDKGFFYGEPDEFVSLHDRKVGQQ